MFAEHAVQLVGLVAFHRAISDHAGHIIFVRITPVFTVAVAPELIENHKSEILNVFAL